MHFHRGSIHLILASAVVGLETEQGVSVEIAMPYLRLSCVGTANYENIGVHFFSKSVFILLVICLFLSNDISTK